MKSLVSLLALATLLLASGPIIGQDGPSFTGNVTLTSDYVFRGISQANEDPAIQGGFDFTSGGFYIGTWGSNVDFGSDAHVELDLYLGYTKEYANGFGWDAGLIQYFYPSETVLDTLEGYFGVSYKGLGLKAYYTDEYFGVDDDAIYLDLSYELSLANDFGLAFHVGQSTFGDDGGLEDYIDYSAAVSKTFGGTDLSLAFHGTDIDDVDIADDRIVFSISRSF